MTIFNQFTRYLFGPPFFKAAFRGDLATIKKLIESGVDVNMKDKTGKTPLILAAQNGHQDIIELLLSKVLM
jgi:ankyrin repeat protein